MNSTIQDLWNNYLEIGPSVRAVKSTLDLKDHQVFNDQIAFRSVVFKHNEWY